MTTKITKSGITNDKISGLGGIFLYLQYNENIGLYQLISNKILFLLQLGTKGLRATAFKNIVMIWDYSIDIFNVLRKY